MFLGVLLMESSHFHLLFEKLLENKPKNRMYFCLKTSKPNDIPSVRYKMV